MKILILANNDVGLYQFRRKLIEAMLQKGHEVLISLPEELSERRRILDYLNNFEGVTAEEVR